MEFINWFSWRTKMPKSSVIPSHNTINMIKQQNSSQIIVLLDLTLCHKIVLISYILHSIYFSKLFIFMINLLQQTVPIYSNRLITKYIYMYIKYMYESWQSLHHLLVQTFIILDLRTNTNSTCTWCIQAHTIAPATTDDIIFRRSPRLSHSHSGARQWSRQPDIVNDWVGTRKDRWPV